MRARGCSKPYVPVRSNQIADLVVTVLTVKMTDLQTIGDFRGRVVKHVRRAFGEDAVALRVGVGAEAERGTRGCCGRFESSFETMGEPFSQLGRCLEFLQVSSLIHHFTRDPIRKWRCPYFMAT